MSVNEGTEDLPGEQYYPVRDLIGDLKIPSLPAKSIPKAVLAFIQLDEENHTEGWSVRTSPGLNDEEVLGLLVGYVEHLKSEASQAWDD